MKVTRLFLLSILIRFLFLPTMSNAQPAADKQVSATTVAENPMTLDIVAVDKAERPVAGLQAEDFKVFDNKAQRNVVNARMISGEQDDSALPVQAFLLIDMINAPFELLSAERKDIEKFLAQAGPRLPVPTSFIFLSETELRYQGEPTRDPKTLLQNLEANPSLQRLNQPQGGYQEYAQMRQKSLQAMNEIAVKMSGIPGRKLIVWISPGWASFSNVSDQKSPQELQVLYNFISGISTELRAARITLYNIEPQGVDRNIVWQGNSYYMEYVKGVPSPKQANNADLALQVIAAQTGGKVLYGSNDIARMIDQCLADSQASYVLTFDAPRSTAPNEYHSIEIKVNKPGLKVRTRTGYYTQP